MVNSNIKRSVAASLVTAVAAVYLLYNFFRPWWNMGALKRETEGAIKSNAEKNTCTLFYRYSKENRTSDMSDLGRGRNVEPTKSPPAEPNN